MTQTASLGPRHFAADKALGRLHLRQLALLIAIDQHESVTQAAAAVGMHQSRATEDLQHLEAVWGVPLFERLARGVQRTEFTAPVLKFANQVLREFQACAENLEWIQKGETTEVKVGASPGAAASLAERALADFKQQRPQSAVSLTIENDNEKLVRSVLDQRLDLAICGFERPHKELSHLMLGKEELRFVVRSGHPLTWKPDLKTTRLGPYGWVIGPYRKILEPQLELMTQKSPPYIIECRSVPAALRLLETSNAIGVLPESLVREHVAKRQLVSLPLRWGENSLNYGLLTRRDEPLGRTATEFASVLKTLVRRSARRA